MTSHEKNKIENASLFCYRLIDGNYIMAEEVDYDLEEDIIYIINPALLTMDKGTIRLSPYCITEISQPVFLKDTSIVSSHEAPMTLRRSYFQFSLYQMMSQILPSNELDEILSLFSPVVDSTDGEEVNEFDFNKPYKFKKKDNDNPWNRY